MWLLPWTISIQQFILNGIFFSYVDVLLLDGVTMISSETDLLIEKTICNRVDSCYSRLPAKLNITLGYPMNKEQFM